MYVCWEGEEGSSTASLISSRCSSVNRFKGFVSCWGCECIGGCGGACDGPGACWLALGSAKSPAVGAPGAPARLRCREKEEALKGRALTLIDRSGSLPEA